MPKKMSVQNRIVGDRVYRDARLDSMRDELVSETLSGKRDRCPHCNAISVAYSYEEGTFLAQCEKCGMMGG